MHSKKRWQCLNTGDIVAVAPSNRSPPGRTLRRLRVRARDIVLLRSKRQWGREPLKDERRYREQVSGRAEEGVRPRDGVFWSKKHTITSSGQTNDDNKMILKPALNVIGEQLKATRCTFCQLWHVWSEKLKGNVRVYVLDCIPLIQSYQTTKSRCTSIA